jgi:hypothetical protein
VLALRSEHFRQRAARRPAREQAQQERRGLAALFRRQADRASPRPKPGRRGSWPLAQDADCGVVPQPYHAAPRLGVELLPRGVRIVVYLPLDRNNLHVRQQFESAWRGAPLPMIQRRLSVC